MTELEFFNLCEKHDWHYHFADDNAAYKKGDAEYTVLADAMKLNPEYHVTFYQWVNYKSYGGAKPVFCCLLVHQAV